jgi:hypothetical protein
MIGFHKKYNIISFENYKMVWERKNIFLNWFLGGEYPSEKYLRDEIIFF